jgi:hypothetical protein
LFPPDAIPFKVHGQITAHNIFLMRALNWLTGWRLDDINGYYLCVCSLCIELSNVNDIGLCVREPASAHAGCKTYYIYLPGCVCALLIRARWVLISFRVSHDQCVLQVNLIQSSFNPIQFHLNDDKLFRTHSRRAYNMREVLWFIRESQICIMWCAYCVYAHTQWGRARLLDSIHKIRQLRSAILMTVTKRYRRMKAQKSNLLFWWSFEINSDLCVE